MVASIRAVFQYPLATGAVVFSILLVIGLLVSDWLEKRRLRRMAEIGMRSKGRALNPNGGTESFKTGEAARHPNQGWGKRRWTLVALPLISLLVTVWMRSGGNEAPSALRDTPSVSHPMDAASRTNSILNDVTLWYTGPQSGSDLEALLTEDGMNLWAKEPSEWLSASSSVPGPETNTWTEMNEQISESPFKAPPLFSQSQRN